MRFRRFLSAALASAMLSGMMVLSAPAASAAQLSAFRDLTDPRTAEAAEFLRLLEVVNGVPGGAYNPTGTLSRAEFCKMAVVALGRSDEEGAQRGRTIYLDVGSDHWARGYINLASAITLGGDAGKGGTALVSGVGDGTFRPNRPITYGEAVTILCRVLGYGTGDVSSGGAWYDGYLSAAAQAGLTEDLSLSGTDTINRGQAAILFYNLYFSKVRGSEQTYLEQRGGKSVEGGVVLSTDATADDGTEGAVKTLSMSAMPGMVMEATTHTLPYGGSTITMTVKYGDMVIMTMEQTIEYAPNGFILREYISTEGGDEESMHEESRGVFFGDEAQPEAYEYSIYDVVEDEWIPSMRIEFSDYKYFSTNPLKIEDAVDYPSGAPAEYFNLQGIKIAKPEKGTFCIERKGGKARIIK